MSKAKVLEILSHVDMTKIDLTSFKISEKKFNELSALYRNRVIISCTSVIIHSDESPQEEVDVAFEMLQKVVNNPDCYSYSHLYSMERKAVDRAINDITSNRDRNINDIKVKAIEVRMKDAYKQMRNTIELALAHGNDFEQELDEAIVERCLQVVKKAIEEGKKKAADKAAEKVPQVAQVEIERAKTVTSQNETETASNGPAQEPHRIEISAVPARKTEKPKVPFWKRIFGKVAV